MAERKYSKYIIKDDLSDPPPPGFLKRVEEQRAQGNYLESTHLFALNDKIIPGSFHVDCVWFWEKKGDAQNQSEIAHAHDWDEAWIFSGMDRENPRELGAELDFWLGDEQYIIDKACLVFVPRGLQHGPCGIRRIDSPVFFCTMGNGTRYDRSSGDE
ncbi:MAG: hypothetical protein MUO19_01795 [Dehalococcoidales bacterium]|nr:hypothetical protein [Dehalococcoidales bacterium]